MEIRKFQEQFNVFFRRKIKTLIIRAQKISHGKEFNQIIAHIENLAQNGKRLRPYIINLAYNPKKFNKELLDQMVGIELLHIFALIHDDIMDGSSIRHGVRTINTIDENSELSKSYAMLAGDMVFNWAYESFLENNNNRTSIQLFKTLVEEVIIGQAIDATLPHRKFVTKEELQEKNILKTARYTFRRPLEIGLALRTQKLDKNTGKIYSQLGENLGIVFQIDDDLLDIFGDEKKLNKKTFQDIESKQATLISFYLKDNKAFKRYFGKKLNEEEKAGLRELVKKSGTLEKIESERKDLINKTEKLILKLEDKEAWLEFSHKITNRDK